MKNLQPMIRAPLLLLLVGLGLGGCNTVAKFEDASADPAYRTFVGANFVSVVPLHLSGVNAPPGYEKTVDYYVVDPTSPSWGGPELITREILPVGTRLTVESVERCTNCLLDFEPWVKAKINIVGYPPQVGRPIHISLQYLTPAFVRREPAPAPKRPPFPTGQ